MVCCWDASLSGILQKVCLIRVLCDSPTNNAKDLDHVSGFYSLSAEKTCSFDD